MIPDNEDFYYTRKLAHSNWFLAWGFLGVILTGSWLVFLVFSGLLLVRAFMEPSEDANESR